MGKVLIVSLGAWLAGVTAEAGLVQYLVDVSDPKPGVFHVTMRFESGTEEVLQLPAFTPGGLIQNHAKYLSRLRAEDARGREVPVRRVDKQTWLLSPPRGGGVRVAYDVAVNRDDRLRLVTNWLDEQGGFFFGTTTLLYRARAMGEATSLSLKLPPGWRLISGLTSGPDGSLQARSYRDLAMAPVQFGPLAERTVDVRGGFRLRLVFDKPLPTHDAEALDGLLAKIAAFEVALFGHAPAHEHLVLFHWRPDLEYGGGVSRRDAMVMNIGREWMEDLPVNMGPTFAHELFHAWNSGAIYPADLAQVDFSRENTTRFLWFIEGVTNYYVQLAYARSRGMSEERFLGWLSTAATSYEGSPGSGWLSLSEADAANWAGSLEYLDASSGGHVAGFLLDLEIRRRSRNAHSLDDAMRALYLQSQSAGYRGYSERDLMAALSAAAGSDMGPFLRSLVDTRAPLGHEELLASAGLTLRRTDGSPGRVEFLPRQDRTPQQVEGLSRLIAGASGP